MFNKDEIDVFDKVGINSVCYGEVLAGPIMPAVMYLTWYKDEPTRNAAWDKIPGTSGLATDQEPAGICLYSHPKHQSAPLTIALFTDIRKLKIKKTTVMRQSHIPPVSLELQPIGGTCPGSR